MTDQRIPSADRQKLRHLLAGSTPGVWKTWATEVMSDQDGTSTCGHAVPVATTHYKDEAGRPRTNDADLICAMRRELPGLLDDLDAERDRADTAELELSRVRKLLDEWISAATSNDAFGRVTREVVPFRLREDIAKAVDCMHRVLAAEARCAELTIENLQLAQPRAVSGEVPDSIMWNEVSGFHAENDCVGICLRFVRVNRSKDRDGDIEVWGDGHVHTFSPASSLNTSEVKVAELKEMLAKGRADAFAEVVANLRFSGVLDPAQMGVVEWCANRIEELGKKGEG